jgi:hypothetical protein
LATAFAVKAAAVTATVGVAGGVGYTVTKPDPVANAEPKVAKAADVAEKRQSRAIAALSAPEGGDQLRSTRLSQATSRRKAQDPKASANPTPRAKAVSRAKKTPAGRVQTAPSFVEERHATPATKKPKPARAKARPRPQVGKRREHPQPAHATPARPPREAESSPETGLPPPNPGGRGPKN